VRFDVPGVPVTQGSKKGFLNPKTKRVVIVDEDNASLRKWRKAMTSWVMAKLPAGWRPLDGPVSVELEFLLPRPARGERGSVMGAVEPIHQTSGDVDKYARAALDSLTTARVYTDDSRITRLTVEKRYPRDGEHPSLIVHVRWTADDPGGRKPIQEALTP
jgi:Holliday junction resolvase RusA-like endonuclease